MRTCALVLLFLGLVLGACAPTAARRDPTTGSSSVEAPRRSRTLVMEVRYEPPSIAALPLREAGAGVSSTTRVFNATLDIEDGHATIHPYLAEALPRLHTDTWRVAADGKMETTYRLKPNLVWHDGPALAAEDFVFAWRVYATPIFGVSGGRPLNLIEQVAAPDSQTLVIRWRGPYPDAGTLGNNFQALPRHVLERAYEQDDPEAFLIHPFWSSEYVGLGPYRLDRWDPGASIEGSAFDGHVLGRPKLDAIRIRFIPDENTGLTTLLAEDVHYATGRSLRFEHALVLKREWGPTAKGTVLLTPDSSRFTHVQFRTDLVNPQALHDLRVRRAIMHGIDSEALNEGLFEGIGSMQGTLVGRFSRYDRFYDMEKAVAEVDKVIVHYPFDLRRAEDLLAEAGFRRGSDGVQTSATGERLSMEVWADAGPQYEKEQAILAATWRQAGIETRASFVPPTRLRDGQFRSSFPALHTTSVARLESLASSAIPTPATRWSGSNRGSWSSPEYDRLWDLLNTTLDPDQRIQQAAAMMRLMTEQLPMWVLYHNTSVSAHLASLTGPDSALLNADVWNIHTWELR